MTDISQDQPLVIFVPVGVPAEVVPEWREFVISELSDAGVVASEDRSVWSSLLDEAGSMEIDGPASGVVLLMAPRVPPTYLWVTLSQPAGRPAELNEAVLDTQVPGQNHAPSWATPGDAPQVFQGFRIGEMSMDEGVAAMFQVTATSSTLSVPELGDVDVCLWFGTFELEAVDGLLPVVANLMADPDLVAYLAA